MNNVYVGDTFKIIMHRYSDPDRLNAARNAAIYLGKSDRDNIRRPLTILKKGHVPEIFRGEHAEFEFVDVDKTTYDHIITYTTRDMRVAGGNRALTSDDFTIPSDRMKDESLVERAVECSMNMYKLLLSEGETPQVARAAMPVAAKMNPFVYQFNFLSLMQSVFPQRIWDKGAQGNTVKVIEGMYELCHRQDPELWEAANQVFGVPALEWKEVRRKLEKSQVTVGEFIRGTEFSYYDVPFEQYLREVFGQTKTMWE